MTLFPSHVYLSLSLSLSLSPSLPFSSSQGLAVAISSLQDVPMGTNREVLLVYNSTATHDADPSLLLTLPSLLRKAKVTVTTISTEPEIYALRNVTVSSGGTFSTVQSADHLRTLLKSSVPPPPTADHKTTVLNRTAFPTHLRTDHPHLTSSGTSATLTTRSYECPVCLTCNASCPSTCSTCCVKLTRSVDLVRVARNLRPVPQFTEVPATGESCGGCGRDAGGKGVAGMLRCGNCGGVFCYQCDMYIHEDIRTCPGCVGTSEG